MRSDNLIKNLLKAAAIVECAYFALTMLLCTAADMLTSGDIGRFIGGYGNDEVRLGFPVPCAVQAVLLAGFFFVVWYVLHNSVQPQKYNGASGILIIVLYFFGGVSTTVMNLFINRIYARSYGAMYYSKFAIFSGNLLTPVRVLHSAAVILLFVAFGMEWYRAALIREQSQNAAAAANRG